MKRWHKRVTQRYAMQRQRCDAMQHSNLAVPTRMLLVPFPILFSPFTLLFSPLSPFASLMVHSIVMLVALSLSLSLYLSTSFPSNSFHFPPPMPVSGPESQSINHPSSIARRSSVTDAGPWSVMALQVPWCTHSI